MALKETLSREYSNSNGKTEKEAPVRAERGKGDVRFLLIGIPSCIHFCFYLSSLPAS